MKKYMILAAVAALTLASCAKIENNTPATRLNDEPAAIGFTNYTPRSLTKANDTYVASTTLVSGKKFAVYAWSTAYNNFLGTAPGDPNFMNPAVVTYNNDTTTGEGNGYTPLRYWPSGDQPQNLSFTAFYPHGGAGISGPTFGTGVGVYTFTAQSTPAAMVDFCVADVVNDQVYGSTNTSYDGTVNLPFKHMLTKVQFKFKKASDVAETTVIELVDAELQNIKTTGTLTATYARNDNPAVNALGTTTTTWSAQGTPASYEVTLNTADPEANSEIVLTTTPSTVASGDIFLMVPQTMLDKANSAAQKIVVTWNVKVYDTKAHADDNGTEGLLSTTQNVKTLYFENDLKNNDTSSATALDLDWAKNQFITYTITIGPKPIYFTATVAGWDGEQNGYFNVN